MATRVEEIATFINKSRPYKAKDDTSVHDLLEFRLKKAGYTVLRRVAVPDNGQGRRGYVDLLVYGQPPVWIEIADRVPTEQAINKLTVQPGQKILVLCRGRYPLPTISGIDKILTVR